MAIAVRTSTSATEAVARFATSHDFGAAPAELFRRAERAVIDTVGVAIAGAAEPCYTILARTLGQGEPTAEATVLATGTRTSPAHAALLNGTAGHALDYDDVAEELKGHPSVVLVSALLAVAEAHQRTGRELLEAYITGFEIACAIARALPVQAHYRNGWHATATVGVLAAAAGAGRLLALDEARMRNALGIAASMASGSRQNFGTMTKPLHAGLAARDAVIAAELAANGYTADPDQLDGPIGYFRQYGVEARPGQVPEDLERADVLLTHGLSVKKYPCCFGTHRAADAVLALRQRGLDARNIDSVRVTVDPGGLQATIHHRPVTGLQGKFSVEYVVAAALLDGSVKLASFTDAAVQRSAAQDLLRRVVVEEAATPPFGPAAFAHAFATVDVALRDGTHARERCDVPRGDGRAPLSDAEIEAKFRDCLDFAKSTWNADALLDHLQHMRASPTVMRW